jgi:undecaprenyl-diphosphatase
LTPPGEGVAAPGRTVASVIPAPPGRAAAAAGACALLLGTLVVAVHTAVVQRLDADVLGAVVRHRTSALVDIARAVTEAGSVPVLLALAAVAGGLLLWARLPPVMAGCPLAALLVCGGSIGLVKAVVGRARPPVPLHLVTESNNSFPSGHAGDSAALYLTLAVVVGLHLLRGRRRVVLGVITIAWVALIGLSRLELGVHWPTDILAGWSLGLLASIVTVATAKLLLAVRPEVRRGVLSRIRG